MTKELPHSLEAEQGLLGCILLDPDKLNSCAQKVKPDDFYDHRNKAIYETCLEMWADRELIDTITLHQKLKDKKLIKLVGGVSYFAELQNTTPSASNIEYYAEIVVEKAMLRELHSTALSTIQRALEPDTAPETLFNEAERAILGIRLAREGGRGEASIQNIQSELIADYESAMSNQTAMGLQTGFTDLDAVMGGMMPQEAIIVAGTPSAGKAQPLDAKILTPYGFWKTMGDIAVGDLVVGIDGKPKRVNGVFPQGKKFIYDVIFSDGSKTQCCAEHLWMTKTKEENKKGKDWKVRTLIEVFDTIKRPSCARTANHLVPRHAAIDYRVITNPKLHPWLLGALLGDGCLKQSSICFYKPEADVQEKLKRLLPNGDTAVLISNTEKNIKEGGLRINGGATKAALERYGLCVNGEFKFIPKDYLLGSVDCRMDVLRGLLDTDGSVSKNGIEFSTSSERLADDFVFLCRSLGIPCNKSSRIPKYTYNGEKLDGARSWRILVFHLEGNHNIVSSQKHLAKISTKKIRRNHRSIVDIVPAGEKDCQCISVEGSMYLTDDFIPTHNTTLALNILFNLAVLGHKVGFISLETSAKKIVHRLHCMAGQVEGGGFMRGQVTQGMVDRMMVGTSQIAKLRDHIFIRDDVYDSTALIACCRQMYQKGVRIFGIDYLQLLKAGTGTEYEQVTQASKCCKQIAKELNCPVLVISSLNRGDKDAKKKPTMSDLRGSGNIEFDADKILLLHCEDRESKVRTVEVNVAKNKDFEVGRKELTLFAAQFRFANAARVDENDIPRNPHAD